MVLREISRRDAIASLKRGNSITVAVKVQRPIQIGLRPLDDRDEQFAPIFCGARWVEEPNRFIINHTQELLELIQALKELDALYCDFFNHELGTSGLVDIAVYACPPGKVRPEYQAFIDINVDPYNWEMAYGQEWIRVGRGGRLVHN